MTRRQFHVIGPHKPFLLNTMIITECTLQYGDIFKTIAHLE